MGMSANPAATAAPKPGGQQGGVYGQSANAYNSALQGTQNAMGYQPMMVSPQMAQGQNVQAGQLSNTNLSPYMNPFQQSVINQSMKTMDRSRQMTQNQNGADATAAGAFGGSRHGVVEAETNRAFADQSGQMVANLNTQNFGQAQAAAGQDIASRMQASLANQGNFTQNSQFNAGQGLQAQMANQQAGLQGAQQRLGAANQMGGLSQMGFGFGQSIGQQQGAQGGLMQGVNQALIDAAKGQYGNWTGAPQASLGLPMAAVGGGAQLGQNTTMNKSNPGLFDYLSSFAGILGGLGGR